MEKILLSDIARTVGGTIDIKSEIGEISTDTRQLIAGSVFIATVGERFDGTIMWPKPLKREQWQL